MSNYALRRMATVLASLCLTSASSGQGSSWITVADVTGDGQADFVIGDPSANSGAGTLSVHAGPMDPSNPAAEPWKSIPNWRCDTMLLGVRVGETNDFSGDGRGEIVVDSTRIDDHGNQRQQLVFLDGKTFEPIMVADGGVAQLPFDLFELVTDKTQGPYTPDLKYFSESTSPDSDSDDGSSSDSCSTSGGDWIDTGLGIGRMAWVLKHWNPSVWRERVQRLMAISLYARSEAQRRYPNDSWKQNAYRHALWQSLLAVNFGQDAAKKIGDIHEDGSTAALDSWIDQYNNARARQAAERARAEGWTPQQLEAEIDRMLSEGELISDPQDPRVPPELRP